MTFLNDAARKLNENYLVYFLVILITLLALGQIFQPFISHDDFDWLVGPAYDQGFETPWSKAATEGRWLNYPWSLFTRHLSIEMAYALYLAAYCVFCLAVSSLISERGGVLPALMVFFAPMGAEMITWPASMTLAVILGTVAAIGMRSAANENVRRLWLAFGVVACFLCYPSIGPLLLICYGAVSLGSRKNVLVGATVYVAAFALGVLIVFTLNYIFHGYFGLKVAGWRMATPLHSVADFVPNLIRYAAYPAKMVHFYWPALLMGVTGYVVCFSARIRNRECVAILLFSALLAAIDLAVSVTSGNDLPVRTAYWVWGSMCAPAIFLFNSDRTRILGTVLSLAMLLFGLSTWADQFKYMGSAFPAMNALGQDIARFRANNQKAFDGIILYGDAKQNPEYVALINNRAIRIFLWKKYAIYSTPCAPEFCNKIENEILSKSPVQTFNILDRKLVVVMSTVRGDLY